MKPIIGEVVSSKPVSLSRAAAALSKFVSSETCAPPEISAYLARASEAFDELVEYHRSLRGRAGRGKAESGDLGVEGARDEAVAGKGVVLPDWEAERRDLGGSGGERKRKGKEKAGSFQEAEGGETSGKDGEKRREDRVDGEVVENGVCGHRSAKKKEKDSGDAGGDDNGGGLRENGESAKKRKKKKVKGDRLDGEEDGEKNSGAKVGVRENGEVGDYGRKHEKKMGEEIKEEESEGGRVNEEHRKNKKKKRDKEGVELEGSERVHGKKKKRKHDEEDVEDGATGVVEQHKKMEVEGSEQLPRQKKRKHDEGDVEGGAISAEERHKKRKVEGR